MKHFQNTKKEDTWLIQPRPHNYSYNNYWVHDSNNTEVMVCVCVCCTMCTSQASGKIYIRDSTSGLQNTCHVWTSVSTPVMYGSMSVHLSCMYPCQYTCHVWIHVSTPVMYGSMSVHLSCMDPCQYTCHVWIHVS